MSREIKFRAWDKERNKMLTDYDLPGMNGSFVNLNEVIEVCQDKRFALMQYTGLKDKQSKDIFEGDIINEKNSEGKYAVVEFIDGSFVFKAGSEQSPCQEWYIKNNEIEVIGNIYETPNLLTK